VNCIASLKQHLKNQEFEFQEMAVASVTTISIISIRPTPYPKK
jgi:hypothetical protein